MLPLTHELSWKCQSSNTPIQSYVTFLRTFGECVVRGDMPSFSSCLLFGVHVTNMLIDIGKKKRSASHGTGFSQGQTKLVI